MSGLCAMSNSQFYVAGLRCSARLGMANSTKVKRVPPWGLYHKEQDTEFQRSAGFVPGYHTAHCSDVSWKIEDPPIHPSYLNETICVGWA